MEHEKELECYIVEAYEKTILGQFHFCKGEKADTIEDAYYLAGKFAESDLKVKIKAIYNIIF